MWSQRILEHSLGDVVLAKFEWSTLFLGLFLLPLVLEYNLGIWLSFDEKHTCLEIYEDHCFWVIVVLPLLTSNVLRGY